MLFEVLVDIQHRVARLVEAGEQLVDDDQQIGAVIPGEGLDHPLLVKRAVFLADMLVPPGLHHRLAVLVVVAVALAAVRGGHHQG
ncbi:hypothetical protein D3C72_2090350 [compost metagenome]